MKYYLAAVQVIRILRNVSYALQDFKSFEEL